MAMFLPRWPVANAAAQACLIHDPKLQSTETNFFSLFHAQSRSQLLSTRSAVPKTKSVGSPLPPPSKSLFFVGVEIMKSIAPLYDGNAFRTPFPFFQNRKGL
jgi:hypothetical protein